MGQPTIVERPDVGRVKPECLREHSDSPALLAPAQQIGSVVVESGRETRMECDGALVLPGRLEVELPFRVDDTKIVVHLGEEPVDREVAEEDALPDRDLGDVVLPEVLLVGDVRSLLESLDVEAGLPVVVAQEDVGRCGDGVNRKFEPFREQEIDRGDPHAVPLLAREDARRQEVTGDSEIVRRLDAERVENELVQRMNAPLPATTYSGHFQQILRQVVNQDTNAMGCTDS